jgi:protein tyrosine kinase modulator
MDDLSAQLLAHAKGIWKYRWAAVIAAWSVAIVGWFIVYNMPNDFQASARIYVDTRNVIKPYMGGLTVAPDMQRQVSIMSRTLISRPNVERLVDMVKSDIESTEGKNDKIDVGALMKNIKLKTTGAPNSNLFTITYNNSDKNFAKSVVESLLTIFVGMSSDNGEDPASAIRFLDEQIEDYENKLVEQENELKAFKQKNLGLMPQQGGDYYAQVAKAAENLNKTKLDLREAERARDSIQQQITGDEPVLLVELDNDSPSVDPSSIVNVEIDARIAELRKTLDSLSLNFTDKHPDIIATKRLIAQLQGRKIEEAGLMKSRSFDPGKNYSPMLQQLNLSLVDSEAKVASMRARVEEYTQRYNRLKSLSNSVPEVEASLAQLNRDYQVNKTNYQELIKRRESAKISDKLGSASKLMSFKIIDPPTVPEIPVGPDRANLFSIALFVALAVGIGIAFALSQLRPSFHSQGRLREITGMPVLGTISMIWTKKEKTERKKRLYALGLSLLSLLGSYGILMVKMT